MTETQLLEQMDIAKLMEYKKKLLKKIEIVDRIIRERLRDSKLRL